MWILGMLLWLGVRKCSTFDFAVIFIKENDFTQKIKQYPAEMITETDYIDDLALLVNKPSQAESLLHRL